MTSEEQKSTATSAKVIYILLIASTIIGISGMIALIMAYIFKDDSADWLQTHYRFQIRTFWMAVLYITAGLFTIQIVIGSFILIFTFVWIIIRCAKGLKQLEKNQPVKNVESWFFA